MGAILALPPAAHEASGKRLLPSEPPQLHSTQVLGDETSVSHMALHSAPVVGSWGRMAEQRQEGGGGMDGSQGLVTPKPYHWSKESDG